MTINKKTMIWKVEYYSSDEDRRIDKKSVDKRDPTVGVVLCGSEASGYFRFRVNPIYITNKL